MLQPPLSATVRRSDARAGDKDPCCRKTPAQRVGRAARDAAAEIEHHARLQREKRGSAPILLLDEIAAHLDADRRAALFAELRALASQAWMTGTDTALFADVGETAQFFTVERGAIKASDSRL